jgi:DNA-binding transcriptional regulator of glucitol operon
VRRVLVSPKWLIGHVLVVVVAVVFCRLGWWQWHRSRETHGNMQYLSYAVQWPLFAAFVLLLWGRIVRDSVRPPAPDEAGRPARARPRPVARQPVRAGAGEPIAAAPPPADADDDDGELAAYNRYLASLHEHDQRERS